MRRKLRTLIIILVVLLLTGGSAKASFSGNFETGNLSQWNWGAQCANTGVPSTSTFTRGTVSISTSPVAQGRYSGKFVLPGAKNSGACEVLRKRTANLDTDEWYAQEVYFPADWREPGPWGMLVGQYNYSGLGVGGPPVGIAARGDHVNLGVTSGRCSTSGCPYTTGNDFSTGTLKTTLRVIPLGTKLAGTWQRWVVHVRWATNSTGHVDAWWRTHDKWTQTIKWGGYPTVQWKTTITSSQVTTDKIGAYRGPNSYPLTIWQDGFCVTTSYSAAVACLAP